jgi:hypothetical protein
MTTQALTIHYTRTTTHSLACYIIAGIICLGALYVILVGSAVANISARKHVEGSIRDTSSLITNLEQSYYSLQEGLTREYALEQGLTEPKNTIFAKRASFSASVNRANEI